MRCDIEDLKSHLCTVIHNQHDQQVETGKFKFEGKLILIYKTVSKDETVILILYKIIVVASM